MFGVIAPPLNASVRATVRTAAVALLIALGPCADARATDCSNPDTALFSRGPVRWIPIHTSQVRVHDKTQVRVRQFRSKEIAGCSGAGNPMYLVKVVISSGTRVLYRFASDATQHNLWLGDAYTLRDVLGLGSPQVLFVTGVQGASDEDRHQHVIPLSGPAPFQDVAIQEFNSSWRETLGWYQKNGRYFAVKAIPNIGVNADIDESCHGCPHHYRYVAYEWAHSGAQWTVAMDVSAERMFDGGTDPVVADSKYVQQRLP